MIIVGQLFTRLNAAYGLNENVPVIVYRFAVG